MNSKTQRQSFKSKTIFNGVELSAVNQGGEPINDSSA